MPLRIAQRCFGLVLQQPGSDAMSWLWRHALPCRRKGYHVHEKLHWEIVVLIDAGNAENLENSSVIYG